MLGGSRYFLKEENLVDFRLARTHTTAVHKALITIAAHGAGRVATKLVLLVLEPQTDDLVDEFALHFELSELFSLLLGDLTLFEHTIVERTLELRDEVRVLL